MGKIVRCISADGTLYAIAADTTDIVMHMQEIHHTTAVASAALGRLLTGASIMGSMLKGEQDSLTLRLNGGGVAGTVVAVSDSSGNVRGYIEHADIALPLNAKGKLDVAKAVGTEGSLTVMRDLGLREPYIGQTPIVSGEIAEDITYYYANSEQTPTVCALGVLVDSRDQSILTSGGFIIQLLPTAGEDTIDVVETCLKEIEPVTTMLLRGMTPQQICETVLSAFQMELLDEAEITYRCDCTKERVEKALLSIGEEDLTQLMEEGSIEVCCHFCSHKYVFTREDLKQLIEGAKKL